MQQEYITGKTKFIIAIAILAIFAGIAWFSNYQHNQEIREAATRNEARITEYRAIVATLDKMDKRSDISAAGYFGLIEKLSEGLKNQKITSEELNKLIDDPVYGNNWLASYRMRARLLEGKEKLDRLVELANSDGKKSPEAVKFAQELGAEINGLNQEISNLREYFKPVDASPDDIARLIKRVKNPGRPMVTVDGYYANFTGGG